MQCSTPKRPALSKRVPDAYLPLLRLWTQKFMPIRYKLCDSHAGRDRGSFSTNSVANKDAVPSALWLHHSFGKEISVCSISTLEHSFHAFISVADRPYTH